MKRAIILILWVWSLGPAYSASRCDVLIVEYPQALTLLDAYQQSVSASVKKSWPPFLPIFLGAKQTLPDGITAVRRVHIFTRSYYLMLGPSGQPLGIENAGFRRLIKNAQVMRDTVRLTRASALPLLHPKTLRPLKNAPAVERLIRLFRHKNYYYVMTVNPPYRFAYLSLRFRKYLQKISGSQWQAEQSLRDFRQQLDYFLNRKNQIYAKLFHYFQQVVLKTGKQPPPNWAVEKQDKTLRLFFSDPGLLAQWPRSTQIFTKELEALCGQFRFSLTPKNEGLFIIRQAQP